MIFFCMRSWAGKIMSLKFILLKFGLETALAPATHKNNLPRQNFKCVPGHLFYLYTRVYVLDFQKGLRRPRSAGLKSSDL